jgi:hypothetical protein
VIAVYDRADPSFHLIAAFYDRGAAAAVSRAEFVIRLKEPGPNAPTLEEIAIRDRAKEATSAGVISDRLVRLPGLARAERLDMTLRAVVLAVPPGTDGQPGKPLRLLTNLLTVPPQVIGFLCRHRWQVELFFKWWKPSANFNHLISPRREGVLLYFYVVVIGVTLMYLHTGFRPSKDALVLLGLAARGRDWRRSCRSFGNGSDRVNGRGKALRGVVPKSNPKVGEGRIARLRPRRGMRGNRMVGAPPRPRRTESPGCH